MNAKLLLGGGAAFVGALIAVLVMSFATPVSTANRAAVEGVVHDYILDHPEILPQAMEKLQAREAGKAVAANRTLIETPYEGAWEGAKDADVTLVEFFDYACGYCRASLPVIDRLLKEDPKLRVVYRDFPVLGPDSEAAAYVSLQAAKVGKYPQFHRALYAAGRPEPAALNRIARQFGLDPATARNDAAGAELARTFQLQRALNLTGTPAWVVGDQVLSGAVGYDKLKAAIAAARKG